MHAQPSPSGAPRRAFLKTLGASLIGAPFIARELFANPPSSRVRYASIGASGQAWTDLSAIARGKNVEVTAVCDVDTANMARAKRDFPKARFYQDWRELLDKEAAHIDCAGVCTPDHMHAPIGMSLMQLGKPIYCQKPLAHSLYEVRRLAELAKEQKLVSQMGIQCHSAGPYRLAVRLLREGIIGKISEVHSWNYKTWGDSGTLPNRNDRVPSSLAWDLWLGVRLKRPYIHDGYYHPGNWRKRLDFGTGTLGDMACHIFDPIFGGLGLAAPTHVRSEGEAPKATNWMPDAKVVYTFAPTAHTDASGLRLTWTDGQRTVADIVTQTLGTRKRPNEGSLLIGSKGAMLLPHVGLPVLLPEEQYREKYRERGLDHWQQFVDAVRGLDTTQADFAYSGPLTEAVLLGGVASRFPETTLTWDSAQLKFDHPAANTHTHREYRKGWEVNGL
ncbi:MAG: Gfo/Idh/MocA family oxidoreductase [Puniceicoccales bacterium]|jgi:predicted dehydrogenase|nr:Gfo/Idh/MocA family oxidoreductase [Puniceicoccales bacterium]